jgi:hypothetical protein
MSKFERPAVMLLAMCLDDTRVGSLRTQTLARMSHKFSRLLAATTAGMAENNPSKKRQTKTMGNLGTMPRMRPHDMNPKPHVAYMLLLPYDSAMGGNITLPRA